MAHLIDKVTVVAEINRVLNSYDPNEITSGRYALIDVLNYLDTLEVKEVDLDFQTFAKEMETVFALPSSKTKNTEEEPLNWEYAIAKHFFELGLKVQKGE